MVNKFIYIIKHAVGLVLQFLTTVTDGQQLFIKKNS